MRENWGKRITSGLLAGVLVLGYVPATAFAAETDGLCPHHTQHTEACGYSAAVEGHACSHEHTGECYEAVTECAHVHVDCGYVAAVEGHGCECQPNENGEIVHMEGCGYVEAVAEVPCGHVCSEETGCINCQHQHNDSCGFVEEKAELPCTFVCEECAKEANQLLKEAKTDDQTEKFQITFDVSGGTILGECPESYTTGNTIVLPTDVQKAGYRFLGWYIGEQCFAEIAADESGDKTFTAKWEEKATVSIDKTQQTYAYDGTEKSFLLKDVAGNTLEIQSGNWVVPCGFTSILTPYGVNVSPTTGEEVNHQGIDLDTGTGWPVMAARSGKIITATYSSSAGFYVKIDHGDGFTSSYLHLSNFNVAAGQKVKAGQQIGTTGATGVSSGDHLHFGIEYNGTAVNPANYISFDGDAFSVTYAPTEGLSSEGLPVEPGSYDVHIVRGETAEYKAIDDTISSALVINRKIEFNGSCGPSLRWEYDPTSKQLSISGTGKMYNYSFEDSPWRDLEILSVVFSGSITSVGSYAFNMCKGLENISLPDTVIHIGEFAFNACVDLKRVELPDSISSLNSSAFIECPSLKEILVDTGNVNFYSDSNGVLYNKEQTKLIKAPSALSGSYVIPSSVDTISDYAFFGCSGLSSIEIPDSVTNIGHTVFYYCIGLTEIHIPESVTEIGGYAFSLCENLEKVNIPSGLTEISKNMFNGCESITEISLPDSVTRIGPNAFDACKQLAKIDIPDFVNYIDDEAFSFCENLSEIVMPWNVWEIGSGAFRQCYNLSKITFKGSAPDIAEDAFVWVTADAYYPADDGSWESDVMLDYGGNISWKQYYGPSHFHVYDENHKCKCGEIGGSLGNYGTWVLREHCLTINGYVEAYPASENAPWVMYRDDICELVINSWSSIDACAFGDLNNLETITFAGLNGIGDMAFANCPKLNAVSFTESVPYQISDTAFTGVSATVHYTVGKYNSDTHNRLNDYGGKLTWLEHGTKAKMLSIDRSYKVLSSFTVDYSVGDEGSFHVLTHPFDATADCEYSLSEDGIIEITSTSFRSATFKALCPGEVIVTARDKATGLIATTEIKVVGDVIQAIECPFEQEFFMDSKGIQQVYSFTPKESGYYIGITTDVAREGYDSCGFSVMTDVGFEECLNYIRNDGIIQSVYYLSAGNTYWINLQYSYVEYGKIATFRFTRADKDVEAIIIEEDEIHYDLLTSENNQNEYGYVRASVFPVDTYGPVQWFSSNTNIVEVNSCFGNECSLLLKNPGKAILTATCNGKSDSIVIYVNEAIEINVGDTLELNCFYQEYGSRRVSFTAKESGRYAFTAL